MTAMDSKIFLDAVCKMRRAQTMFFTTTEPDIKKKWFFEAKKRESEVDKMIQEELSNQAKLF